MKLPHPAMSLLTRFSLLVCLACQVWMSQTTLRAEAPLKALTPELHHRLGNH